MRFRHLIGSRARQPAVDTTSTTSCRPVRRPTIVVGVDGSLGSVRALDWAIVRAWADGSCLLVLHVYHHPRIADPYNVAYLSASAPLEVAWDIANAAAQYAVVTCPDLDVRPCVREGTVARAILREATDAQLIVLGRNERRRTAPRLVPSVPVRVGWRARGRLVVVGADDEVRL